MVLFCVVSRDEVKNVVRVRNYRRAILVAGAGVHVFTN